MKINFNLVLSVLLGVVCFYGLTPPPVFSGISPDKIRVLQAGFPEADSFSRKVFRLKDNQKEEITRATGQKITSSFVTVYSAQNDNQTFGYGLFDSTRGKSSLIKYFVGIKPDGQILTVEVIEYQGEKGASICRKEFKQQFAGKGISSRLMIGDDIDAMSGATISSRALTNGVRKLVHLWHAVFAGL